MRLALKSKFWKILQAKWINGSGDVTNDPEEFTLVVETPIEHNAKQREPAQTAKCCSTKMHSAFLLNNIFGKCKIVVQQNCTVVLVHNLLFNNFAMCKIVAQQKCTLQNCCSTCATNLKNLSTLEKFSEGVTLAIFF